MNYSDQQIKTIKSGELWFREAVPQYYADGGYCVFEIYKKTVNAETLYFLLDVTNENKPYGIDCFPTYREAFDAFKEEGDKVLRHEGRYKE
jgi:hypothetical protein